MTEEEMVGWHHRLNDMSLEFRFLCYFNMFLELTCTLQPHMIFGIALVFPDVSNWLHFHPLHCLSSTFFPFLSNCTSCDTEFPFPKDSGLFIPFWTGFSLGLLRTQLGSLDSLSSGLMFLIPASHVYLSHGYPLPSSIIKQAHNLFFFLQLMLKQFSVKSGEE